MILDGKDPLIVGHGAFETSVNKDMVEEGKAGILCILVEWGRYICLLEEGLGVVAAVVAVVDQSMQQRN